MQEARGRLGSADVEAKMRVFDECDQADRAAGWLSLAAQSTAPSSALNLPKDFVMPPKFV